MIIALFGGLIVVLGMVGLVSPDGFRGLFTRMDSRNRFIFAIVIRLVLGGLLWWLAEELRYPHVMRILAVIAIAAAVGLLLMGRQRLDRLVDCKFGCYFRILSICVAMERVHGKSPSGVLRNGWSS